MQFILRVYRFITSQNDTSFLLSQRLKLPGSLDPFLSKESIMNPNTCRTSLPSHSSQGFSKEIDNE
jgi:hypothetical protein